MRPPSIAGQRGTGGGIYLALSKILAHDPEATVSIFPSDHFICPRSSFISQVECAQNLVEDLRDKMVLMGVRPDVPETDYGWIEPGARLLIGYPLTRIAHQVLSFHEKPSKQNAERWYSRGYLWNTMIVSAKARTLWEKGKQILPFTFESFEAFLVHLRNNPSEKLTAASIPSLFQEIPVFDFSKMILSKTARESIVLPLEKILWSDWGRPERVFSTLKDISRQPRIFPPKIYQGAGR